MQYSAQTQFYAPFNQFLIRLLTLLLLVALTSCGGGGGSVDGAEGSVTNPTSPASTLPDVKLTFPYQNLKISSVNGPNLVKKIEFKAKIELINATGAFLAVTDDARLFTGGAVKQNETEATFFVDLPPDLDPGSYKTTISVFVCADIDCNLLYGASPFRLPFVLEVLPNIVVQPNLQIVRTGAEVLPKKIVPFTAPPEAGSIRITSGNRAADPLSATVVGNSIEIQTYPVRAGTYDRRFEISSESNLDFRASIDVSYVVNAPAGGQKELEITDVVLGPAIVEQGQSAVSRFRIQRPTWIVDTSVPVLKDNTGAASLKNLGNDNYEVLFDSSKVAVGTFADVSVELPNLPGLDPLRRNFPIQISSAFAISGNLSGALSAASTDADLIRSVAITSSGSTPLRWSARSLTPGINVVNATGLTNQDSLNITFDKPTLLNNADGLAGSIEVSVDKPGVRALVVAVALSNQIPRIVNVLRGPIINDNASVDIAGVFGFAEPCIQVIGANLRSKEVVDDNRFADGGRLLRLKLDGAQAGRNIEVKCVTPLQTTVAIIPVKALSPISSGYAALPLNKWRSPQYSHRTNTLFFAGDNFAAQWSPSLNAAGLQTLALPGLIDIGLLGDESQLIAVGANRAGWKIATDTLQAGAKTPFNSDFFRLLSVELTANEGQSVLGFASDGESFAAIRDDLDPTYGGVRAIGSMLLNLTGDYFGRSDPGSFGYVSIENTARAGTGLVRSTNGSFIVKQYPQSYEIYNAVTRATNPRISLATSDVKVRSVSDDGTRVLLSDGRLQISGSPTTGSLLTAMPSGVEVGGFGLSNSGQHALVYGYQILSEPSGPKASNAGIWIFDISQAAQTGIGSAPLLTSLKLPSAVGCTTSLQAGETCLHTATVMISAGNRSVFVLGPRGVAAVTLPEQLAAKSTALSPTAVNSNVEPMLRSSWQSTRQ
jgi:hypothetical protein